MKITYFSKPLFFLLITSILTNCVSKKKFDELLGKKNKLDSDKNICDDNLKTAKTENNNLKTENTSLKGRLNLSDKHLSELLADSNKLSKLYNELVGENGKLSKEHERLRKDYKDLFANTSSESNKLNNYITRKEKELLDAEAKNKKLEADLALREQRLKELESVLENKDKAVRELKEKVAKSLLGFNSKDLTVNIKNGKVYVSLSEQLLFKSGSINVDPKGVDAIKKLATVLKNSDDISAMIEGHTDNVPMNKNGAITDNWDLSVLRATSITRILVNEGVPAGKISPTGRGEFNPIAEGSSPEARSKNRRIEIILTPKLDELFKLLDNN